MLEIPVYVFMGFLESGKTTFINDTLEDRDFITGEPILLIACEEGEAEYNREQLEKCNISLVEVEDKEQLTAEFYSECQKKYKPKKVMIEYNGMWTPEAMSSERMPRRWQVVQVITTVAAPTFELYLNNMRSLMMSHFTDADMVIFNRCNGETKKAALRKSIKAVNRRAQIYFEAEEGVPDTELEEDLPFDVTAEVIEIQEDDYGLWYLDAVDNPKKYEGKRVHFKAVVYKSAKLPKGSFVPGRFAMTCCADDIGFIGFLCKCDSSMISDYNSRDWIEVTAKVGCEYQRDYNGEGPVLYAENIQPTQPAQEDLVYFT
ncbi:MAG: GTPase [Lachnospiraceae bacterium]|nr:GTPase [Lachnospiraceae bacterium]